MSNILSLTVSLPFKKVLKLNFANTDSTGLRHIQNGDL